MTRSRIIEALKAVEESAKDSHEEQLAQVREIGETLSREDNDIIQEFQNAIAEYEDGRRRLAEAIAAAAAKVGHRQLPDIEAIATSRVPKRRPLPHEFENPLKLY